MEEHDDEDVFVKLIVTPDEFLLDGLHVFYKERRIQHASKRTNIERFKKAFGIKPVVCACVWEDLQRYRQPVAPIREQVESIILSYGASSSQKISDRSRERGILGPVVQNVPSMGSILLALAASTKEGRQDSVA
jgi:hypothetical protein